MPYLQIVLVIVAAVFNHKLKNTLLLYAQNKEHKTVHSVKKLCDTLLITLGLYKRNTIGQKHQPTLKICNFFENII